MDNQQTPQEIPLDQQLPPEDEAIAQANEQNPPAPPPSEEEPAQKSKEVNFKRLREEKEKAERLAMQREAELNALKELLQNGHHHPKPQVEEESGDDEAILTLKEYRRIRKMEEKNQEAKRAKEEQEYRARIEAELAETKLRNLHKDWDAVVTPENIERLKEDHPEIAMTLSRNTDPISQGQSAYKMMKALGYGPKEPTLMQEMTKQKIAENKAKPQSSNQVPRSQALSSASAFEMKLSKDMKAKLWQEMQEARKFH